MNRFTTMGLLLEATLGKSIAVVSGDSHAATEFVNRVDELGLTDVTEIVRTYGAQRVRTMQGGEVRFYNNLNGLRGRRFDVIVAPRSVVADEDSRVDMMALEAELVLL